VPGEPFLISGWPGRALEMIVVRQPVEYLRSTAYAGHTRLELR
jgi:hypothetical protein